MLPLHPVVILVEEEVAVVEAGELIRLPEPLEPLLQLVLAVMLRVIQATARFPSYKEGKGAILPSKRCIPWGPASASMPSTSAGERSYSTTCTWPLARA